MSDDFILFSFQIQISFSQLIKPLIATHISSTKPATMGSSIFCSAAPYHIISYGALLGTTFFHSFINGIVMFRTLERPDFAAVQSKLFPIYFSMQTFIPLFLAVTYPASKLRGGLAAGFSGVFAVANRWAVLAPLAIMLTTGAANLLVLEPLTTQCMRDRRAQGKFKGRGCVM